MDRHGTSSNLPRLAITMGDPAGVGAEVILRALGDERVAQLCRPVIVGDSAVLKKARAALQAAEASASSASGAGALARIDDIAVVDLASVDIERHAWGEVRAENGAAAAAYIERAVAMVVGREADAVVTAPIHKEALRLAGLPFPGHTEMVAHLTGTNTYAMMLVAPSLRVVHVSTHVALAEATRRVTRDRVLETILLTRSALRSEGVPRARIAVAGLNPHASEHGLFGGEEQREIAPAILEAQQRGVDVSGPHPPDTVFVQAVRGSFDAVVVMYHDQGHIPIKLLAFDEAVNVTVGLPIIRTSVDHGTAFDIAGTGAASPRSMIAAMTFAARLVAARPEVHGGMKPAPEASS